MRDQTHIVLHAKRYWLRLYNILESDDEDKPRQDYDLVVSDYSSPRFPKWSWIGIDERLHASGMSHCSDSEYVMVSQVTQISKKSFPAYCKQYSVWLL